VPPIGDGELDPAVTSDLIEALDTFNNLDLSGDECEADEPACGDGHVDAGEQCDDGNTTSGDGCSATCETEAPPPPPPCCGDGHVDAGEQCDDGNTTSGDGCSATCTLEPVCVP
jgi:large repetitive protein